MKRQPNRTVAQGWVPRTHGIISSYMRGCRCELCTIANRSRSRARDGNPDPPGYLCQIKPIEPCKSDLQIVQAPHVTVLPDGTPLSDHVLVNRLNDGLESDGDCLVWRGASKGKGYGRIKYGGRNGQVYLTHRLAWYLTYGEMPGRGVHIMHSCDNPPCCNIEHLSLGDARENITQAIERGLRTYERAEYCLRGHPLFGENLYTRPNGTRVCRTCRRETERAREARKKAAA